MEYGTVTTEWVDESFAAVSTREDIDGMHQIVLTPDRQIKNDQDGDGTSIDIVMDAKQARQLARMLNRAARRVAAK